MATTSISTAKLNSVAKHLDEVSSKFRTSTTKLFETGQQLDKMWDGEASQAFMHVFRNDMQNFEALAKFMNTYADIIRQNAATYTKAENDAKNIVSKGMARG